MWDFLGLGMEPVSPALVGRFSMKVKEESEKAALKLNIRKTKIMAPGPITLWQREEGKGKAVTDFISLGSQITADRD